jgi:hypothetical protein
VTFRWYKSGESIRSLECGIVNTVGYPEVRLVVNCKIRYWRDDDIMGRLSLQFILEKSYHSHQNRFVLVIVYVYCLTVRMIDPLLMS